MAGVSKSISTSRRKPFSDGAETGESAAVLDAHRAQNLEITTGRAERDEAGRLDGCDELGGAAVHDRHFRAVDLDQHIVEAEAGAGRHQMLDRGDGAGSLVADHRAQLGGADLVVAGVDELLMPAFEALAQEDDAGIGSGRPQGQAGRSPGMNADALQGHGRAKGRLPFSHHTLYPSQARKSRGRRLAAQPVQRLTRFPELQRTRD